jgi:uroporphyrinogen decarboxylase
MFSYSIIKQGRLDMKPRERVFAALNHQIPDRVPRFEIWIDALLDGLGQEDTQSAHVNLGQDSIMMHSQTPETSNAWKNGVDEWGRLWKNGMYVSGVVESVEDIKKYSVNPGKVAAFFDEEITNKTKSDYPHHCLMYGSHLGPFMAAYMAMGFEKFFLRIIDDPAFIHALLEDRTEWAIAMFRKAGELGAEVMILGEDAAHKGAPMISPKMWREFVLPYHHLIVDAVDEPMIFHSDGNILPVLPMVIDAGFIGYHSLEPAAGIDLGNVKEEYGKDLVLIGNVDVGILAKNDLQAVRDEVDRCISQGAPGGGYMIASCNSIFEGLNPAAVTEMFRYTGKVGYY